MLSRSRPAPLTRVLEGRLAAEPVRVAGGVASAISSRASLQSLKWRAGGVGPDPSQHGVGRPGFDRIVEVQRLGVFGGEALPCADGVGRGEQIVPGRADEGAAPGEVAVEEELVGMGCEGAGPGVRVDHVEEVRVAGSVGEASVEEEEAAVERVRECGSVGGVGSAQGFEGAGVAPPAAEGDLVRAAQQRAGSVEQGVERGADEHVAVVEEHLAVAVQPEGFKGVEVLAPAGKGRVAGGQMGEPVPEPGGHRLEPHAVGEGLEGVARGLGECVVDDDEVAVEAWMVLEEGAEQDEGARDEGLGGGGGEADAGGGRGFHWRDGTAQLRSRRAGSRTVGSASGRWPVGGVFSIIGFRGTPDFAVHCPDGRLGPGLLRRIGRRGRVRISYGGGRDSDMTRFSVR